MVKNTPNKTCTPSEEKTKKPNARRKNKTNVKPQLEEHLQQIPYRLREIMKSKEQMGSKKLKKKYTAQLPKMQTPDPKQEDIPVPHFHREKKESKNAYLKRMNLETQHVLFLTKIQKQREPERDLKETKKSTESEKPKKQKISKKKMLHLKKKAQKQEDAMEKEMFIDEVQFGEVAMTPPVLTAKPRKAPVKSQGSVFNAPVVKPSMARQRIMAEEHERVVQAYRHLKRQREESKALQKEGLNKLLNPQ